MRGRSHEDEEGEDGFRKDGKPYAPGNTAPDGGYINGHKRAPIEHRFAVGDERKRGRRAKGSKGLKTHLEEALKAQQLVRINGEPVKASRQRLMMTTLAARAASGDIKAATLVIAMIEKAFGFEDRNAGQRRLSAQDQAILDEVLRSAEEGVDQRGTGTGPSSQGDKAATDESGTDD